MGYPLFVFACVHPNTNAHGWQPGRFPDSAVAWKLKVIWIYLKEVCMPLVIQNAVLDLIEQVTGGKIERKKTAPCWLNRPGKIECGRHWPLVCEIYADMTGLKLPELMPPREWRHVDGILKCGASDQRIVEVDESQHFNIYRGRTLKHYTAELPLAFDRSIWMEKSQAEPRQKSGNWAKPRPPLFPGDGGRHKQRAFRDALADILPPANGFLPTLRIAYFEVEPWIEAESAYKQMQDLLNRKISKARTTRRPPRAP